MDRELCQEGARKLRSIEWVKSVRFRARGKNKDQFFYTIQLVEEHDYGINRWRRFAIENEISLMLGRSPILTSGGYGIHPNFTFRLNPDC